MKTIDLFVFRAAPLRLVFVLGVGIWGPVLEAQQPVAPRPLGEAPVDAEGFQSPETRVSSNVSRAKESAKAKEAGARPKEIRAEAIISSNGHDLTPEGFSVQFRNLPLKSTDRIPPVCVRFNPAPEEVDAALTEDLSVMSRLLEQSLERALRDIPRERRANITLWISGSRSVRAMYVEGFGVLFMVKVNVPLVGPPALSSIQTNTGPANSEWERARQELSDLAIRETSENRSLDDDDDDRFDAGLVEALQTALLQSLKEAARIRHLKPSEYIALSVFGPAAANARAESKGGSGRIRYSNVVTLESLRDIGTVLALRVSMENVTAFARGNIDFESFKKKTETHGYAGLGHKLTSISSWALPARSGSRGSASEIAR